MEPHHPHDDEIGISSLVLRYAHTRIARPKALNMMIASMDRYGQITPVIVVMEGDLWVLIDGYLRVGALTHLGRDTVAVRICPDGEMKALLQLLGRCGERQWEAIEQAWLIRDIKDRFECSLAEIARGIGRDLSWVSRRLSLIDALSEDVLQAICRGRISTWSAARVLVPLARANPSHAQRLTQHLCRNPMSSREMSAFLSHYERSNKQVRERMIYDPSLFAKAYKSKDGSKLAIELDQGPEGHWIKDCGIVTAIARRLEKAVETVIYPGQDEDDRTRLVRVFHDARSVLGAVEEKIRKVDGQ
jgi:ParB-like chromosome segregation protein Spo0J